MKVINNFNPHKGLTLVETLVAISVLLVVISISTQIIQSSFKDQRFATKQSVAIYLANDGIERVRQRRDNNLIQITNNDADYGFWEGLPVKSPSETNKKLFTIYDGVIRYCSEDGNDGEDINVNECDILIVNEAGEYQTQTPDEALLPDNSFRTYHEILPQSTSTKKRLQTTVNWLHNNTINDLVIITELSNVNPPSVNAISPT